MNWPMVQVRHVARLEYGSSLPAGERVEGVVAVFGSNGPVGLHNSHNTGSPVMVVGRKGSHGKLQYSSSPVFAIDTTYFIDPARTRAHIKWLYYALSILELDKTGQDVGVPGLSREYAYSQRIPLPLLAEQQAIADYLDTETERIDNLITRTRRLIELLQERRQTLITAAVTGTRPLPGLTPLHKKDQRRDEGSPNRIIQSHERTYDYRHQLVRIGHVCSTVLGKMLQRNAQHRDDQKVPYLRAGLFDALILSELPELPKMFASKRDVEVYSVREGDLLVAEGGDVGRSEFAPQLPNSTIFQNSLHRVGLRRDGDIRFVRYALMSIHSSGWLEVLCNRATFGHLTVEKLRLLRIPWPKPSEQRAIADYLDIETGRIDNLITKNRRLNELLQERRQTLITAAVTGDLPLREIDGTASHD